MYFYKFQFNRSQAIKFSWKIFFLHARTRQKKGFRVDGLKHAQPENNAFEKGPTRPGCFFIPKTGSTRKIGSGLAALVLGTNLHSQNETVQRHYDCDIGN